MTKFKNTWNIWNHVTNLRPHNKLNTTWRNSRPRQILGYVTNSSPQDNFMDTWRNLRPVDKFNSTWQILDHMKNLRRREKLSGFKFNTTWRNSRLHNSFNVMWLNLRLCTWQIYDHLINLRPHDKRKTTWQIFKEWQIIHHVINLRPYETLKTTSLQTWDHIGNWIPRDEPQDQVVILRSCEKLDHVII